jgi:hypothetical protein
VTDRSSRIAVIGCSGSGKSTFAPRVAERLGLPYVSTDAVFWTPDWKPTPSAEVRAWLEAATAADAWVTDGNFDDMRHVLWARAELIVWIDLPLATTLWRVARRNFGWWLTRTPAWGGLPMTFGKAMDGVRHMIRSHGLKRRTYPAFLAERPSTRVVRLTSPAAVAAWLTEPLDGASR